MVKKEFYKKQDELYLEFLERATPLLTVDNLLRFVDEICNDETVEKFMGNIIDKVVYPDNVHKEE